MEYIKNKPSFAPLLLFAYNRPSHLAKTLKAISANEIAINTDLFVFCDGPKKGEDTTAVREVQQVCSNITGFKTVTIKKSSINQGLANSIISGVSELINKFGKVIVIEDDIVTTPNFLIYMNKALDFYQDSLNIFSIAGYGYPESIFKLPNNYKYDTYTSYKCCSWGWGTWENRWSKVKWDMPYYPEFASDAAAIKQFNRGGSDMAPTLNLQYHGKIDSWAIRFCYAHYENNSYCVYPSKSLANNIGLDGSGTYCGTGDNRANNNLDINWLPKKFCPADTIHKEISDRFKKIHSPSEIIPAHKKTLLWKMLRKIKNKVLANKKQVSILFANTVQKDGGAARAAWRIFKAYKKQDEKSCYVSLFKNNLQADGLTLGSGRAWLASKLMRLDQIPLEKYPDRQKNIFSPAFFPNFLRVKLNRYQADIVHLHWVAGSMLSISDIGKIKSPVVWTLHDAWAFTGGCHYVGDCQKYKNDCGNCPALESYSFNDLSHKVWRRKKKAYDKLNIQIVTPSHWLKRIAEQSSLLGDKSIEVIPNGLDLNVYKPIPKNVAKQYFNLPEELPVVLIGSEHLNDPRKGGELAVKALKSLKEDFSLLSFGKGELPKINNAVCRKNLGILRDDYSLSLAYSAADVFLCMSKEDNLPNTIMEALACGTPCVAFAIGGIPEMIQHKKNGWLATPYKTKEILAGLKWIFNQKETSQLNLATRKYAEKNYDINKNYLKYVDLYEDMLRRYSL